MHKFSLVEQAFIKISFLENPKIDGIFDRVIFTSQNAVNAVFSSPKIQKMMEGKRFYCVGKRLHLFWLKMAKKWLKLLKIR